jgi:glycosyltransferase involved in cell wall biosynthesis
MRVLQLCPKPLFEPMDGGKIAMLNTAKGLNELGVEVVQWMIHTRFHKFPVEVPTDYHFKIEKSFIDTSINWKGAIKNLFSKSSYNLQRFNDKRVNEDLIKLIEKYKPEVIQSESIYCLTALKEIKKKFNIPIVLRAHNIEHLIWKRTADYCRNPIRKIYLNYLSKKLRKDELEIANQVDAIAVLSEVDFQFFNKHFPHKKIAVVGIGTELERTVMPKFPIKDVFHIGAMDWKPNEEGLRWFVNECWPIIHKSYPYLKCVLAGNNMPPFFLTQKNNNIQVTDAPNAEYFMNQHDILIVPLLSGSGIRVKIIEALALGKVVIATNIAIEGLGLNNKQNVLIANNSKEFLECVSFCIDKPEISLQISENAAIFAQRNFSTKKNSEKLIQLYHSIFKN